MSKIRHCQPLITLSIKRHSELICILKTFWISEQFQQYSNDSKVIAIKYFQIPLFLRHIWGLVETNFKCALCGIRFFQFPSFLRYIWWLVETHIKCACAIGFFLNTIVSWAYLKAGRNKLQMCTLSAAEKALNWFAF